MIKKTVDKKLTALILVTCVLALCAISCGTKTDEYTNSGTNSNTEVSGEWKTNIKQHWHEKKKDGTTEMYDYGYHEFGSGTTCSTCKYQIKASDGLEYELASDGNSYIVKGIGSNMDDDVVIPSAYNGLRVTTIANEAFKNSSFLKNIIVLHGIQNIGEDAFRGCKNLNYVYLPESVIEICDEAFVDCNSLKYVNFHEGLKKIGGVVFMNTALTTVTLPESIETIDNLAFSQCEELSVVTIGRNIKLIDGAAFRQCEKLTTINYTGTREEWKAVEKGEEWDRMTSDYTVYCSDGRLSKNRY